MAPYPKTTIVLLSGCKIMLPLKLPFFLLAFSTKRNITAAIKQQLQMKTIFEKKRIFLIFDV